MLVREIDNWRNRHAQIEDELRHYKVLETKINEYENRIVMLTQEIERLNNVVRSKI